MVWLLKMRSPQLPPSVRPPIHRTSQMDVGGGSVASGDPARQW